MDDYASRQRKPTKHLIGLGLVVVLHLLLFWAISSGLARAVVKKILGPVEAILLEEAKPDIPPPPPPTQTTHTLVTPLVLSTQKYRD